ncbi:protein yellow-like, partial [Teleopsis dalmanni]|uniref:protein yellow-like n=1 Tax=Teleopsis dalmanni TaxID=139649 RepID=UPI0018CCF65C
RQFAVSTRILRDENRVEDSYHDFMLMDERGPNAHTTARVMSDDGIELFNLIDQNAVGCWHSSMPYAPEYHGIVDRDDVGLVFPADVKIDENKNVWVLSDRMPVFLLSDLDYKDVNFRIYNAPLSSLVENTVCDIRNNGYVPQPTVVIPKQRPVYKQYVSDITKNTVTTPVIIGTRSYLSPSSNIDYGEKTIPSAYVFNQHNGLSYETNGPHLFPLQDKEGLKNYVTSRNSNWWRHHHLS